MIHSITAAGDRDETASIKLFGGATWVLDRYFEEVATTDQDEMGVFCEIYGFVANAVGWEAVKVGYAIDGAGSAVDSAEVVAEYYFEFSKIRKANSHDAGVLD